MIIIFDSDTLLKLLYFKCITKMIIIFDDENFIKIMNFIMYHQN